MAERPCLFDSLQALAQNGPSVSSDANRPNRASRYGRVSHAEVDRFFSEYVFGFMCTDVRREVELAQGGQDGGNFLAALGLLCYTEVMGGIDRQSFAGGAAAAFNAFFDRLGPEYAALRKGGLNVYRVFRCGMAHEYLVKRNCVIGMVVPERVLTCGIGVRPDGRYYFNVERYLADFEQACGELHSRLSALPNPVIPSPT